MNTSFYKFIMSKSPDFFSKFSRLEREKIKESLENYPIYFKSLLKKRSSIKYTTIERYNYKYMEREIFQYGNTCLNNFRYFRWNL